MAESVLPVGLENLKIDVKRELQDDDSGNINPFNLLDSGVFKKKMRIAGPSPPMTNECLKEVHSCPKEIFGNECLISTQTDLCQCAHYIPTKFESHGKRSSEARSLLQIKSTTAFKKNILRKSKLNILKIHDGAKSTSQDPSTLTVVSKSLHLLNSTSSDGNADASKCTLEEKEGSSAINVMDFKSLIPSSEKPIMNNPMFDTSSFKSLQNVRPHRKQYCGECTLVKSDEDELVSSVSRKLSVTGTANNTATCSQEARLTANAYCDEHDISIDELASYFEDFVHIPKKMSLMAEQMYI